MTQPIKIDIWSDIACPWCYLGKHRFETALAEFQNRPDAPPVEVEYHSFQLMPEMAADHAGSHAEHMATHLGWSADKIAAADSHLQTLGAQYGLDYNFATNQIANTHKAHELLHFAKAHGRQHEVKEGLFKAHFSDGAHIGRVDELAEIAAAAGLDGEAAKQALDAGDFAEAVEADKAMAARYGISGVPFFVVENKYGLSGAQEPATFLRALEQVTTERSGA